MIYSPFTTPRQAKGQVFEAERGNTEDKPQSPADVVESLGMGWAQILVWLLGAGGIFLVEGFLFGAISSITLSASKDLNLSNTERSMLSTLAFSGLCFGIVASGWIADILGRRIITVLSYVILTVSFFLCAILHSWIAISIAGFWAGFGSGFGMPSSIAMLSEVSPMKWRMVMAGAAASTYSVGVVYTCVLAAADDDTLMHLHWRKLMFNSAVPVAGWTVLAAVFLPESPVFYASKGLEKEAAEGFRTFGRRNGKSISGNYVLPEKNTETLTFSEQVAVIFSSKRWFVTLATAYACIAININGFGTMYAQPIIFAETSFMPAAYQNALTVLAPFVATIVTGFFGDNVSRKSCVLVAFLVVVSCNVATRVSGGIPMPRTWALEALYQYGAEVGGAGRALAFVTLHQIAVEIYPPSSSATGGSFVMGIGRIGAVIAPPLFELMRTVCGTWQSFYVFMDVALVFGFFLFMFVPSPRSQDAEGKELTGSKPKLSAGAAYSTMVKEV